MMLVYHVQVSYAQKPLVFKNINADNGLPQNTVLSILQDKKGYIWVGTYDGLSRYDGQQFKTYKTEIDNPASISNNKINKLFEDRDGNLWVGAVNGLNLFDPKTNGFTRFRISDFKSANSVLSIAQDAQGTLWVGTNNGLFYIDLKSKNAIKNYLQKSSLCSNDKVSSLYVDRNRQLWIGTGQTLKIYDAAKSQVITLPGALGQNKKLLSSVVRGIVQDHFRNYWIATETNGLFFYNPTTDTCFNYTQESGLLSSTIRALMVNDNDEIWIGTKKGLNIIDPATKRIGKFINDPLDANSLSQNSLRCIYKDNEGDIWMGTFNGGLNVVYGQYANFFHLGIKKGISNGLSYTIVNNLMAGEHGDFWVGTDDGGINHIDSAMQQNQVYYQYNGIKRELLGNSIKSIAKHTDTNKLWVATGSGLNLFDKRNHLFTKLDILPKPTVSGYIQNIVLLNDAGGLWIGTNFNGLYYLEKTGKLNHYHTTENNVTCLFKDGDNLWVGTKDLGLDRLNVTTKILTSYQADPGKPYHLVNNDILTIYKDLQNRLWVGTDGGGLHHYDPKNNRFYSIAESLGIANSTVHAILEDKQSRLWISTNKGLSCIGFNRFEPPFKKTDLNIANYSVEDGLQSNQFTSGAVIKTGNGNLVFGGINGLTAFNPAKIKINRVKPVVVFTDFLIFNKTVPFKTSGSPLQKPIDETNQIILDYSQAFFSIKFAALNYINPEKNQFAFKLDGFTDNEWHYVGNQQIATYTNLDPGTYFFKIKAANNDGIWNEVPRVLRVTVLPPWWKTWWAYTGYALGVIGLLYLFNLYSKKTERLKNELRYESVSHIKDQELARKQLSFFVNISHEIKTPLTMIMAPLEKMLEMNIGNTRVQHQLTLMQRNGARLMRLINQLLDTKKLESGQMHLQSSQGNMVAFMKEILVAFEALAKLKNITLKLKVPPGELMVWYDGDKLEKVLYNLLSNAVKFTPAYGRITLSITQVEGFVSIDVEDNGCGIAQENTDKIFTQFYHDDHHLRVEGTGLGLAFSKELVGLHHGELQVESKAAIPGVEGFTRFTIKLPTGKSHLKETELASNLTESEDILNYQPTEKSLKSQLQLKKAEILKKEGRTQFSMLVVEDNEDVLNFIKDGFEPDFEVQTATDGIKGLELARKINPDIIISDVMMPGMSGIDLCGKLKSDIQTSHIPVILLTARTQLIFKMEGLETGADDYVTKPFNFNMLETRVWNLIGSRQKLRERYRREIKLDPQNIAISNLDEIFLKKVLSYIEQHLTDPNLTVEALSQETAMSRNTFYVKIKSLTNQTGVEFIRSVRLKRAAQLLSYGQLTVNEVAYMVGFMDVNYFRKCFKEQFNYTPKEQPILRVES